MIEASSNTSTGLALKRILFVDDDLEFLQMIERLMGLWSNNSVEVLTAQSARDALAILNEGTPDLIVMDVCMPVVDGLQLLAMVNRRYPQTPKVILTSQPDDAYRTACLSNGAELFLAKPSTSEAFEAVFATLNELMRWNPEPGFRGTLRSVGLTDVIQMECIAKSSSILTVGSKELNGAIFIEEGAIIHAEAGETKGEQAFKNLIALVSGDFRSLPFTAPPEVTIDQPWESLLMDAAQARDELLGAESEKEVFNDELRTEVSEDLPSPGIFEDASPPLGIDELVICSEAGDVYHAWQCEDTEMRIHFLEALSQKARMLQERLPSGCFDRAEFIASGARLIAHVRTGCGVMVRASLAGVATAKNDSAASRARPSAQAKTKALSWFEEQFQLPGLLAGVIQFPDHSGPSRARTPQFTAETVELLVQSLRDTFQSLTPQRVHAQRAQWTFENVIVEAARWRDGTILSLVFNRRALEMNMTMVEKQVNAFVSFDAE
ncbi:MAG: response regulator [Limisphaerales bacterium]